MSASRISLFSLEKPTLLDIVEKKNKSIIKIILIFHACRIIYIHIVCAISSKCSLIITNKNAFRSHHYTKNERFLLL